VHTDDAGGAAVDLSSAFTMPATNGNVGYSLLVTLGGSGVETVYTITGTRDGVAHTGTGTIAVSGGTAEINTTDGYGWDTITAIESDVDPQDVSEFDTLDVYFPKPMRGIWVGGAGNVTIRYPEDSGDTVISGVAASAMLPDEVTRIRCDLAGRTGITQTTATLISVAR